MKLVYHPAYDLHHGAFRFSVLLAALPERVYAIDHLRILDFYYLFPHEIGKVRFPAAHSARKQRWKKLDARYEQLHNPYRVFHELAPFQMAALRGLVARGLLDPGGFQRDRTTALSGEMPGGLGSLIANARLRDSELLSVIVDVLAPITMYGHNGLKARTQLFEHRYDLP